MPNVKINITGASYKSRSLPLSAQSTVNFYPELQEDDSTKEKFVLQSFPGAKLFGTATGKDRGMFESNNILYHVVGNVLYTVDKYGTHTSVSVSTVPGSRKIIFAPIGTSLVMAAGSRVWVYDGTSSINQVVDADLETPQACTHLNNQIIYDGDGSRFVTSDVGDPLTINGLNYAAAESDADALIRPYAFNQLLYLFGAKTTEVWWNSGIGSPPYDRVEGGILQIGLGAIFSASNNDSFLYFLGDDRRVYRIVGSNIQSVSTIAISNAIEGFTETSDAIGLCFTMQGQNFYYLTFPIEDKSFCYSEQTNQWFELSSNGGQYVASSYAFAFGKHLISDRNNGNIYELDINTFDENGAVIKRTRDTGPLDGGLLGAPGKRVEMNRFELIMETGTGIVSGQGSDPVVMLSFSDDGGKTFSTEKWGKTGKLGHGIFKVEWHALGSFYSRVIRVHTSDPVAYSIHKANADLEVGI